MEYPPLAARLRNTAIRHAQLRQYKTCPNVDIYRATSRCGAHAMCDE